MDDMLVKNKRGADHISDFGKIFEIHRHYKMKLNATKCTFWVSSGKFLCFMVNNKGIEANLEKIQPCRISNCQPTSKNFKQ